MQYLQDQLQKEFLTSLQNEGYPQLTPKDIVLQKTRKEFEGEFTLVLFGLLAVFGKNILEAGNKIGQILQKNLPFIKHYEIISGFLNLSLTDEFWVDFLLRFPEDIIDLPNSEQTYLVEFSSPNTNKPLHLGHLRNNFLGDSIARILKFQGHRVVRTQIINDRGIHICKSMLAWQKWGGDDNPTISGMKGDKWVGKYYVLFDQVYKQEVRDLMAQGVIQEEAEKNAPILLEAQDMLKKWEQGDLEIIALWEQMNAWVYQGFSKTYQAMGIQFDKNYFESQTYLLGKSVVQKGLAEKVFYTQKEGAIACDLTAEGLDEKIVQRKDGTSVYITQDLGTALQRAQDFPHLKSVVYVVASEQDYHFKVLFSMLKKMGYAWASACYHLSYGLVELPSGKMKSREGTVVDADELLQELEERVQAQSESLGKLQDLVLEERQKLYHTLALAALKYYLLRVDPKKKILFNPEESIQLQGDTAIFVQYTYVRIKSLLKKTGYIGTFDSKKLNSSVTEKRLMQLLSEFYKTVENSAIMYNPALLVNYLYELVSVFNHFYQSCSVLQENDLNVRNFRIFLSRRIAQVIEKTSDLLGFSLPEKM